jgi:hypothetical protein
VPPSRFRSSATAGLSRTFEGEAGRSAGRAAGGGGPVGRERPVLVLPGAPCPFCMFGQLCVVPCVADGLGVAAALADPLLAAVVPDVDDEVVDDEVDADVDGCEVAALATAMLAPNPTPSAPAPTAVPMRTLLTLDLNMPASSRLGDGPGPRTPTLAEAEMQRCSVRDMKSAQLAGRATVKTSWPCWVVIRPMPVTGESGDPDGASAVSW